MANQALLMKWIWQWLDPNEAWWKAGTVMAQPVHRPWNDANGTAFWKGIKHIETMFNCSINHLIGNGINTNFWHDNWQDGTLKFMFPNLYKEAHAKNCSVSRCTNIDGWHLQLPALSHRAQMEKDLLFSRLQRVNIPQSHDPDTVLWTRHPTSFSTATAYRFISNGPRPSSFIWNIWKIRMPLRVQIFAWLMLSNRLTTIDNLSRWGWTLPNMCVMCKADAETTHHLIHRCSLTIQIRAYIQSVLSIQRPVSYRFVITDSAQMLTDPTEHMVNKNWELTTYYVLWRERCHRIFSDKLESHI